MTISVKTIIFTAAIIGAVALATQTFMNSSTESVNWTYIDPTNKQLVADGQPIYAAHCATCHGVNLEGEPNWRTRKPNGRLPAPPHDATGHTWHHADALLIDITQHGLRPGITAPVGYVSDMPAYKDLLSTHEIHAVLAYIKSSWPKHAVEQQKALTLHKQ